jgi:hypothetical protein
MTIWISRLLSTILAILLCCTPELCNALASQTGASSEQNSTVGLDAALPDAPSVAQASRSDSQSQSTVQQQPEGTAAARAARVNGGPASKPAGAAIAPAKQRRTRSLLIKLGVIAGAGAAVGTVVALTKASPTRPPGAH